MRTGFSFLALCTVLTAVALGGDCSGYRPATLGGIITDGAGDYPQGALCSWDLPTPGPGERTALNFTHLHVSPESEPCLSRGGTVFSSYDHLCMLFSEAAVDSAENLDAIVAPGDEPYIHCTSHLSVGATFVFSSRGVSEASDELPGFTATVVSVDEALCDNPTDFTGLAFAKSPWEAAELETTSTYGFDDEGELVWWGSGPMSLVAGIVLSLVCFASWVRLVDVQTEEMDALKFHVARLGASAKPAAAGHEAEASKPGLDLEAAPVAPPAPIRLEAKTGEEEKEKA